MSIPNAATPKTFFGRHANAKADNSLCQASANLPPAPTMPTMRSRSASAPVESLREHGRADNALSFFTRPHALVGVAKLVNPETETASDDASANQSALIEAQIYALMVQVHGKSMLEPLSSHRKGWVLVTAARLGYLNAVKLLLKTDTDLSIVDGLGENAMMAAARAGQLKVLARLLKVGCSIECCLPSGQHSDAIAYALQHGQAHAAAMMALHHNIRLSQIVAGHSLRAYKGESPISLMNEGEN